MNHCWKDKREDVEERLGIGSDEWVDSVLESGTCMLERGHDGPHEFVPDAEIVITFTDPTNGENDD